MNKGELHNQLRKDESAPNDYSRVPLVQRDQPRDRRIDDVSAVLYVNIGTLTEIEPTTLDCVRLHRVLCLDGKPPIMRIIYGLDTVDLRFILKIDDINQGTVRLRHVPSSSKVLLVCVHLVSGVGTKRH